MSGLLTKFSSTNLTSTSSKRQYIYSYVIFSDQPIKLFYVDSPMGIHDFSNKGTSP